MEKLAGPDPPVALAYLWAWYTEVASGRADENMAWTDIEAWAELVDVRPQPHDVRALMRIAAACRKAEVAV